MIRITGILSEQLALSTVSALAATGMNVDCDRCEDNTFTIIADYDALEEQVDFDFEAKGLDS